jgi:hypothetical protein
MPTETNHPKIRRLAPGACCLTPTSSRFMGEVNENFHNRKLTFDLSMQLKQKRSLFLSSIFTTNLIDKRIENLYPMQYWDGYAPEPDDTRRCF